MDLQSILKPGKQVELTIQNSDGEFHKLKTLVESGFKDNSFGVITPIYEGSYYPLHINDKLEVTFDVVLEDESKKKDVYKMKAMVLERKKIEAHSVLILSKISTPSKIQRRNTYRLHILKNITYSYNGKTNVILLKNISASGLRGIIEERIPAGAELEIDLDLENEEDNMTIKSKVIACDQVANSMIQYDLRVQFFDLKNAQKSLITNFIFRKQSEAIRKTVDLEGHGKFEEMKYGFDRNKRRGGDFIVRTVPILGLVTWFITLSILALIVEARPEKLYNLDIYFNYYKRGHWREDLLTTAFFVALLEAVICAAGLYMNSKRMKRDGDYYNRGLIFNLVFSLLIIVLYVIFPFNQ